MGWGSKLRALISKLLEQTASLPSECFNSFPRPRENLRTLTAFNQPAYRLSCYKNSDKDNQEAQPYYPPLFIKTVKPSLSLPSRFFSTEAQLRYQALNIQCRTQIEVRQAKFSAGLKEGQLPFGPQGSPPGHPGSVLGEHLVNPQPAVPTSQLSVLLSEEDRISVWKRAQVIEPK